ncbi:MAG: electron transfer flavoprotein subunit beta/FixA family protein, partial [Luteibaculum sp.]
IRKALAIGADNAVRVDTEATDAYQVAQEIANYAKDKGFDLILCGKETIDYNGSQVGGILAGLLDLPYVSLASHLETDGKTAEV